MRTTKEMAALRERAIQLRQQGKSRRQIKEILGSMSNSMLDDALKGEPPPGWTRRARAKDDLRERARELRTQGLDLEKIAAALGVAKSSVSLWVRDLARPARLSYEECRKRAAEGAHRYWAAERPARAAARATTCAAAAAQVGTLTDRELLIAGAIAYWCEGGKSKPGDGAEEPRRRAHERAPDDVVREAGRSARELSDAEDGRLGLRPRVRALQRVDAERRRRPRHRDARRRPPMDRSGRKRQLMTAIRTCLRGGGRALS